jgi:hypothetical protein
MKKSWFIYMAISLIVIVFSLWDDIYPVKIIDVHRSTDHSGYDDIIVDHFPLTDRGELTGGYLSGICLRKIQHSLRAGICFDGLGCGGRVSAGLSARGLFLFS